MAKLSIPMTQLIHENLSILMSFAFSRRPLHHLLETKFLGNWKYLEKALIEMSDQRAQRACLELALLMRMLDDEEKFSARLSETKHQGFGRLVTAVDSAQQLGLRDVCNKIIHASSFAWDLSIEDNPILVCNSSEPQRWVRAEI